MKCLAFCDNEEKSKSLFRCGICAGRSLWLLKKKELDQWLPRAGEAGAQSPEANLRTDQMKQWLILSEHPLTTVRKDLG